MAGLAPLGPVFECRSDGFGRQAPAHRGLRGSRMHNRRANPGSFEFHLVIGHHGHHRGLGGSVGAHVRALAQCDVGTNEDQVAALALDHAGQDGRGHSVRADKVNLDLGFETVGADLV